MKTIVSFISELPEYEDQELQEFDKYEEILKSDEIYQNNKVLNNINLDLLKQYIKRKYLFDCLRQSFQAYKNKWAFSTISNLLKKLYKEKNKFSENEYKEIESMIDTMNNKITSNISLDSNRSLLDNKIKANALNASHNVTDSRSEKLVSGDSWQSKQAGLSNKSYINN
jgi:hypothetical protein